MLLSTHARNMMYSIALQSSLRLEHAAHADMRFSLRFAKAQVWKCCQVPFIIWLEV